MDRQLAIAYGVAALSVAVAIIAVLGSGAERLAAPDPLVSAAPASAPAVVAAAPALAPAPDPVLGPVEPPVVYVDERGRPLRGDLAARGDEDEEEDEDDEEEEHEDDDHHHRRGDRDDD